MSRLLFENSKFALGFAGVTLFGAAIFAGVSDYSDAFGGEDEAAVEAAKEAGDAENNPAPNAAPTPAAEQPIGFAEDEMLIDEANGFNTGPSEVAELGDPDKFNPGGNGLDGGSNEGRANGSSDGGFGGSSERAKSAPASRARYAGDGDSAAGGGVTPTNVSSRNIPTPEK